MSSHLGRNPFKNTKRAPSRGSDSQSRSAALGDKIESSRTSRATLADKGKTRLSEASNPTLDSFAKVPSTDKKYTGKWFFVDLPAETFLFALKTTVLIKSVFGSNSRSNK